MAYQNIDANAVDSISHIPKFGGELWFVSSVNGNDNNTGMYPDDAFATIGKAITESSDGDSITIMQGTYTETGIDVSKTGLELHFEIGAIISPASGNCLTISGNYCWVGCHDGALRINNDAGANTGVLITGNWAYLQEIRVANGSVGDIGFDIQGGGCDLRHCRTSDPLTAAYKIQGDKIKLEDCCTGGTPANTSIGYWLTNSCDKARLIDCGSQGHSTAPFQVDSGCTNAGINKFSSGGGDGKWVRGEGTVVSDLTYEETKFATSTLDGNTTYNLFKVTGAIKLFNIFGHVETAIANTSSTMYLDLHSTNADIDITDSPGINIQADVVGTVYSKQAPTNEPLIKGEPDNTPSIIEEANFRDPNVPIILIEDDSADTYIRVVLSDAVASGAIHWHVEWQPITDDGFLEIV